jgi:hypothetical protein
VETATVEPAVLPGTPETFPVSADALIERAKSVFETKTGLEDDSVLSDDFRFEFPIVSLDKESYLKAVRGFQLTSAFPNLDAHPYDWRVDKYEPNRVWFTVRNTGTHLGELKFGSKSYPATGKEVKGAPECLSYTFNEDLLVTSFTGGYVMDRRVGNTQGMGALFGILAAIGVNFPKPGTFAFTLFSFINRIVQKIKSVFAPKEKSA